MPYDPYDRECSGDHETTTDQTYLRHSRMELQNVTAAVGALTRVIAEPFPLVEPGAVNEEPDAERIVTTKPPPDYGRQAAVPS
jgi:hypothetical protein